MGVMKEEKKTSARVSVWTGGIEGVICETGNSSIMMVDVKLGEDWTGRGHQKSLGTNRRRESKKFLVEMIEIEAGGWTTGVCFWAWISGNCSWEFFVGRRALLVPVRQWWKAEDLHECTKNYFIFKEGLHKKKRDHLVYCSGKIYYLPIAMYRVPERPSKRVLSIVGCWAPGPLLRQFPRSASAVGF